MPDWSKGAERVPPTRAPFWRHHRPVSDEDEIVALQIGRGDTLDADRGVPVAGDIVVADQRVADAGGDGQVGKLGDPGDAREVDLLEDVVGEVEDAVGAPVVIEDELVALRPTAGIGAALEIVVSRAAINDIVSTSRIEIVIISVQEVVSVFS